MIVIGGVFATVGILIDMFNLYLGVRSIFRNVPSGIPVLGLAFVAIGCLILGFSGDTNSGSAWRYFYTYLIIHILINYGVVLFLAGIGRFWRRR